jgi:hypothetical protein
VWSVEAGVVLPLGVRTQIDVWAALGSQAVRTMGSPALALSAGYDIGQLGADQVEFDASSADLASDPAARNCVT